MATKPDLNKLKAEIAKRKNEMTATYNGVAPRDTFLNGLLESLQTGRETVSTNLVKTVENKVAVKNGEAPKMQVNENTVIQQHPVQQQRPIQRTVQMNEYPDYSPERDEQLYVDLERKRKQTLAESMQGYINTPPIGTPMSNQVPAMGTPMVLNEAYLGESVKKLVDNYLVENFSPIVEEAIHSTIIEMYAVDRIKAVLSENKEMIKKIVYETIKELQAKVKQNKMQ